MAGSQYRKLTRSRTDKMLGGVCGGLGEYFGIDPVIFRIIFAVAFLVYGTGFGVYVILWLVMPEATRPAPHFEEATHDENIHHDDDEWSDF
jgi:phage shock protein C